MALLGSGSKSMEELEEIDRCALDFSLHLSMDELPYSDEDLARYFETEVRMGSPMPGSAGSTLRFVCNNLDYTRDSALAFQF